ncbi:MAG: hypothetical protein PVF45_09140 [Anaerolineae bacterium]|jgi:hypothetical protein
MSTSFARSGFHHFCRSWVIPLFTFLPLARYQIEHENTYLTIAALNRLVRIYYLDADRLEKLERYALYRADQEARTVLRGLSAEIYFNLQTLKALSYDFQAYTDKPTIHPRRCRNTATEQFLASPLLLEILNVDFDFMDKLWSANEELNRRLNEWSQAMIFTEGVFRNNRQHALELIIAP